MRSENGYRSEPGALGDFPSFKRLELVPPSPWCSCERSRSFLHPSPESRPEISSPEAAAGILVPLLRGHDREHAVMLGLDTRQRLIGAVRVSIGTVEHTFIGPREVFRDALALGASLIVLGHNHPSGDPTPSQADREVTARLHCAGAVVGIELLDHLVIGSHDWASLARQGVL